MRRDAIVNLAAKLGEDYLANFRHVPAGVCLIQARYANGEGLVVLRTMRIRIPEQSSVVFVPDQQR